MRAMRQFWRRQEGQAAVEFALVLPFLLIMLVGIVEFGRAWNEHQVVTDAAREAARRCAISDTPASTETDIENVAKAAMAAAGIASTRFAADSVIEVEGETAGTNEPCTVTIKLPYRFTFFGPLVSWATGYSTILLHTSFSMRNE